MYVIERWKGKKCIVGEQLNTGSRLKTFDLSDASVVINVAATTVGWKYVSEVWIVPSFLHHITRRKQDIFKICS